MEEKRNRKGLWYLLEQLTGSNMRGKRPAAEPVLQVLATEGGGENGKIKTVRLVAP